MKFFAATLVACAGLGDALVSRAASCCFHLSSSKGPVGQLSDGQNRVNQTGLPTGQYCIDGNGGLTDQDGRGCILTPPTTQFQCDVGAAPTPGFSVGCDGVLAYNGNTGFPACPTGDNGGYNLYTIPPAGQQGCITLALTADGCNSGCPSAPAPPKTCPLDLLGSWETPHLIVPVDSSKPNTGLGTSYNGTVSSTVSSIFNFDISNTYAGKTCSLMFLFPMQSQLATSAYEFSGNGNIDFCMLNNSASSTTAFGSVPGVKTEYGLTNIQPGHSYSVANFPCPAGSTVGIMAKADGDTYINYFQDYNPSPIGLYISVC